MDVSSARSLSLHPDTAPSAHQHERLRQCALQEANLACSSPIHLVHAPTRSEYRQVPPPPCSSGEPWNFTVGLLTALSAGNASSDSSNAVSGTAKNREGSSGKPKEAGGDRRDTLRPSPPARISKQSPFRGNAPPPPRPLTRGLFHSSLLQSQNAIFLLTSPWTGSTISLESSLRSAVPTEGQEMPTP
jgi:hypothetical protein